MWNKHIRMSAESECCIYHDPRAWMSHEQGLYLTDEDRIMVQNKAIKQ